MDRAVPVSAAGRVAPVAVDRASPEARAVADRVTGSDLRAARPASDRPVLADLMARVPVLAAPVVIAVRVVGGQADSAPADRGLVVGLAGSNSIYSSG